jgi:hypothetical protein
MPIQSRGKWVGRAKQMVGRMKRKLGGAAYGYKRATAGSGDILQGKSRRIEASLEKSSRKPNLGQLVKS